MRYTALFPPRRVAVSLALTAAAATLALTPGATPPATASTIGRATGSATGRVGLPDPTPLGAYAGQPGPLATAPTLSLRVYLSGQPGRAAAALAVSSPGHPRYGHYLTAAQFRRRYGATAAQVTAVSRWLAAEGMTVTATTPHYVAVNATVADVNAAFGTTMIQYNFPPIVVHGHTFPGGAEIGTTRKFSVPAALGGDVAAVTGLQFTSIPGGSVPRATSAPGTASGPGTASAPGTTASPLPPAPANGYDCSHYWRQHTEAIPAAYGATTAPTQLCGYTPGQLRTAYGVSSSRYTGRGVTIAVVMNGNSPTMLSDANRFFRRHQLAGFAPGQYTESDPASVAASCSGGGGQSGQRGQGGLDVNRLEEAIDVESVHITAPDAHLTYVAADCNNNPFGEVQALLDAATRVSDQHLADVVSGSFSDDESLYSPADAAAWDLTFEQGAIEGIGFDLASGDGGAGISGQLQPAASVCFPSSSPWVTAVGGTTLEIGRSGAPVADFPWGDNGTKVNAAGTGYTLAPPGRFLDGSTGGLSRFFAEPGYQQPVVPAALATRHGTISARRVIPDISANAEGSELIGYTGAIAPGRYGQITEGGTSEATPLFAGLEADAIQAAGHPLGFLNPALYLLHGSAAFLAVPPVNPASPPVVIGTQQGLGAKDDYLTTLGEDQPPLQATTGYDDETGLGTPGGWFVTSFRRWESVSWGRAIPRTGKKGVSRG